tara:strand:+ start:4856 stop:5677 length:822 start_codon:yes stop_codon:yes gene_type:complete
MKSIPIQLSAPDGLAWNQKATMKLEGGPTYDEIILDFGGTITDVAKVKRVAINLNGDEIIRLSGAEIKMLEAYRSLYGETDKFCLSLEDIANKSEEGQRITSLVTLPGDNITLTVEIGNFTTNASDPLEMKGYARVSAAQVSRNFIPRIYSVVINAAAAGENDYTNLTRGPRVSAIHFKSANMTALRIKRDRIEVHEPIPVDVNNMLLRRHGRVPQAGYYHFDPIASKWGLRDLFATQVQESLVFKLDVSAGETITALIQSVELVAVPVKRQA